MIIHLIKDLGGDVDKLFQNARQKILRKMALQIRKIHTDDEKNIERERASRRSCLPCDDRKRIQTLRSLQGKRRWTLAVH